MTYKLKVIKEKAFKVNNVDQKHYVCAYKGRVFGISTLRWEEDAASLSVDKGVLTITTDIEVQKNTSTDALTGETKTYLDIVPKCGLTLAEF